MATSDTYRDDLDLRIIKSWEKQLPSLRKTFGEHDYPIITSVMGIFKGLIGNPRHYGFISSEEATDYFWFILLKHTGFENIQRFKSADELVKEYPTKLFKDYLRNPKLE